MKISAVTSLQIPDIKVIRFDRFADARGYFVEPYRQSAIWQHPDLTCLKDVRFLQAISRFSRKDVVRGLHFQFEPAMGKLIRVIQGQAVDVALDIRVGSPTWGKIVGHLVNSQLDSAFSEWIWLPPGFAHGIAFLEDSLIEYFCTSEWNPQGEACISIMTADLDWSLCESDVAHKFRAITDGSPVISDKDRQGMTLKEWQKNDRASTFMFDGSPTSVIK